MKYRLIGVTLLVLALFSSWLNYRIWQARMCKAEVINILSLSHFDHKQKRRITLGELLQHGDIQLRACYLTGGIELSWQFKSKIKAKYTSSIKLVDKAPTILYFKSDRRIYSWATSSKPLRWIPMAFPQIKNLIEN